MKYKIDPEFAGLIPAVSPEQEAELEQQLLSDGRILHPLILWKFDSKTLVLLDGHRRDRLMTRHPSLKAPAPALMEFESRQEAHDWIIRHQLSKRNTTDAQRKYLIGKLYVQQRKPVGRANSANLPNFPVGETAEKIAAQHNVSERAVRHSADFAEAVDAVAEVSPEVKDAILSGETKASDADVKKLAALPKKKRKAAATKIASGEATVKEAVAEPGEPKAAEVATDKLKSPLPENLRPAFEEGSKFAGIVKTLGEVTKKIEELAQTPSGVFLSERWLEIKTDLGNAKHAVKFSAPYQICPYCKGKGCKATASTKAPCRGTGWTIKGLAGTGE